METINMVARDKKITLEKGLFEKKAWKLGHFIVGVDEVGRGCLAGPVLAAAVILPLDCNKYNLKDSKIMSPEERNRAYDWIIDNCFVGIGMADQTVIDHVNIYQATSISMKKAVHNLYTLTSHLIIDSIVIDAVKLTFTHPHLKTIPVHSFIKGETYSKSIAAASIIAKVTRDRIMENFDTVFNPYHLKNHKGYATKEHQKLVLSYGESIIHRKTFLTKILNQSEDHGKQQSLF